ncbi:MAG: hypothetical protein P8163_08915 [Candidatus Thiodiazotropha sp.]
MSLFVVINVLEHAQLLSLIGQVVNWIFGDRTSSLGTAALLLTSSLFSSVTENIILSIMLAKILANLKLSNHSSPWRSVVFGVNLGSNITPIGTTSILVATTIIQKHQLKMTFVDFVKIASPFAVMQLSMATVNVLDLLSSIVIYFMN